MDAVLQGARKTRAASAGPLSSSLWQASPGVPRRGRPERAGQVEERQGAEARKGGQAPLLPPGTPPGCCESRPAPTRWDLSPMAGAEACWAPAALPIYPSAISAAFYCHVPLGRESE